MKKKKLHPVHPREVLLEEFLKPMGLSQNKPALNIGVPARRVELIFLFASCASYHDGHKGHILEK